MNQEQLLAADPNWPYGVIIYGIFTDYVYVAYVNNSWQNGVDLMHCAIVFSCHGATADMQHDLPDH